MALERSIVTFGFGELPSGGGGGGGPIAACTLAVADLADGTGATATITNSHNSSTAHEIFVGQWDGELGTVAWESEATRTGNGTASLTLATGFYWAYVASEYDDSYAISEPVYFVVTDGEDAILTAILQACKSRIELLALSGLASVVIQKKLNERLIGEGKQFALPACILAPMNWASPANAGTNEEDDCTYSIACVFFSADNQVTGVDEKDERQFLWLQKTAWAFRQQRLPGVPTIIRTEVQPGEITVDEAWKDGLHASALLLKFISREERGLT